ncbi:FRIGIDA-like protein 2 [Bidens hawaiensis]|uniref:FRIGIDA-like protein 2 n=1 Tax=Bidens hawaiensis TaxID=980011 RepID=UPI00404AA863
MADISAAIDQITTKKQTLLNSFINLQSQTPNSFNLPFNWSDLDTHFTNLQSTLVSKFNLLQTHQPDPSITPARPELKSFCKSSDGSGLKKYISGNPDQELILSELPDAYRFAPDAAGMVLDAIEGFYSFGCKGNELRLCRTGCLVMLEGLVQVGPVVSGEVRSKAMEVADEWNKKRGSGGAKAKEQNALGFLLLVGAYGLVDWFKIDDVIDSFVVVAANRKNADLCRRIVLDNNIKDLFQKLIDNDMHVPAVNLSIDLQKTNVFSPIGLLEDRKLRSLRVIEEARANVEDLQVRNDVIINEINTLKSIIECIEKNHLQSDYPKDSVVELVSRLENEVENNKQTLVNNPPIRKQPTRAVVLKHQLPSKSNTSKMPKRRKLSKVQPTAEPAAAAAVQEVSWIKDFLSPKSDLSSPLGSGPTGSSGVRVGECKSSPLGSGPTDNNLPRGSGPTGSYGVHAGESQCSPLGSGPAGSNAPCVSPVVSLGGSTRVDIGYNFYVKQSQPPDDDDNSNGWISD